MTISGVFVSVLSGAKSNAATSAPPSAEQVALRKYEIYRRSFPMTEVAFPACTLRNYFVAKWVRDRRLARFNLVGLHCDVGPQEHEFLSYPAAVGDMITELAMIRRSHGAVLTRLDDACATLRFPRPLVVPSPGVAIVDRNAA